MVLAELNDLYVEETALLKRIHNYLKEHTPVGLERVETVRLLMLYRIFSNLNSAWGLTEAAIKKGKMAFYQLPIGIILRCCYTDCLFALYLQSVDKKQADEELDLRRIEYANSLLERKEVYRDQVKSTGDEFDDKFIDHMWELNMEDNFLGFLTLDNSLKELTVTKRSKQQLKDSGFSKTKSISTKDMMSYLTEIPELKATVTKLYHYYRYFSQYEHFSENGLGDILESAKKDGNDNIHLPSAIRALNAGVEKIFNA